MEYVYPTLLQSANRTHTTGCFDVKMRINKEFRKQNKRTHGEINSTYTSTHKLQLYPSKEQKKTLKLWLDDCIDVYNITNKYIKENVDDANKKTIIKFRKMRDILKTERDRICKINGLYKHTADYMIKHCVEMYKSAISNHKKLDKFNIKDLLKDRRRKNLTIEPENVSSKINAIFISVLGKIESSSPLNLIKRNSTLQYDTIKDLFFIIIPSDIDITKKVSQYDKVGVDIGARTFLTTYSRGECMEIAPDNYNTIDTYNNKKDSIRSNYDTGQLSKRKYNKAFAKYSDKLKNRIEDLHNKACKLLLIWYKEIIIGKVSIKQMISNISGNLRAITKRRLVALSHYKFREKLKNNAFKYGCTITEVSEYLTSKTCSNCGVINDKLGSSKVFKCKKCKMRLDRDINASINIYKNEKLSR